MNSAVLVYSTENPSPRSENHPPEEVLVEEAKVDGVLVGGGLVRARPVQM